MPKPPSAGRISEMRERPASRCGWREWIGRAWIPAWRKTIVTARDQHPVADLPTDERPTEQSARGIADRLMYDHGKIQFTIPGMLDGPCKAHRLCRLQAPVVIDGQVPSACMQRTSRRAAWASGIVRDQGHKLPASVVEAPSGSFAGTWCLVDQLLRGSGPVQMRISRLPVGAVSTVLRSSEQWAGGRTKARAHASRHDGRIVALPAEPQLHPVSLSRMRLSCGTARRGESKSSPPPTKLSLCQRTCTCTEESPPRRATCYTTDYGVAPGPPSLSP